MNPAVGIDLGTTNTVVAVQTDDTGPRLVMIPQPVEDRRTFEARDHIKSAVVFESSDAAVVGAFAARRLDSLRSIKSRMGTRWRMAHPFDKRVTLTPSYVSAHILKCAFDQVCREFPEWDHTAIVTVPASFNTDQRNDTLHAARLAGLQDVRLLDEPTAAFYHFFDQNRDSVELDQGQTILVFDFGGGTLDVSIIRVALDGQKITIDPVGRSRYNNLGGDDIDADLAAFFLAVWQSQGGFPLTDLPGPERRLVAQLFQQRSSLFKEEVEDYLKNEMELNEFAIHEDIRTTSTSCEVTLQVLLTRAQDEEVTGRFLSEKSELNVFRPIRQALDVAASIDPALTKRSIDLVLYTGGASRMAGVHAALESYFSPRPCYAISDDEACNTVALGAASCRYDEMHRQRSVSMRSRLLESIMTRDTSRRGYVSLVPLECEPSADFRKVDHEFRTEGPAVTLRVPLFRGVGPDDHHLAPMEDLRLRLPHVVDAGVPYDLLYRMTENKTIELKAQFRLPDGMLEVRGELSVDTTPQGVDRRGPALAKVN